MSTERLNRYLARRGVSSRRGADALIAAGRVRVNGTVSAVGAVVDPAADRVTVDERSVADHVDAVTVMLNKPLGVVSTRRDPQRRTTVMSLVERLPGLVPVGRLDTDSRGLLLLTTDGELAHRLTHPRYGVTKTYHVTVGTAVTAEQLARLRAGLELNDGFARPVAVNEVIHARDHVLEIIMGEGRKREVRRLCAAVGLDVIGLRRVAFGPLEMTGLAEGAARRLEARELAVLYASAGLDPP